ncbi:hypothetical protein EV702DRAFT_1201031 [Suillus placidus]|uniref:Uncharacterized protein n=1 Tax=Suillus placidus TaxID=48579 RepID=A0A9P6ZNV4_9AGAM|nr:hypothetical protein EV702DRAFT_1201031 [Suillus placidus]
MTPIREHADIQPDFQGWSYKAIDNYPYPLLQPHAHRTRTVIFLILPQDFLPHGSLMSLSVPDFIPLVLIVTPSSLSLSYA